MPYVLACCERECDKGYLTTVKLKTDALHLDIPFCSNYLRMMQMQTRRGGVEVLLLQLRFSLRLTSLQNIEQEQEIELFRRK